jgi:biofilm PGA synthesis N-glycosyltransferase PgaC
MTARTAHACAPSLRYAVVTPVRDEAASLGRLAASLRAQLVRPVRWHIVDTGSQDGTADLAASLERAHGWISYERLADFERRERGATVVAALERGFRACAEDPVDVAVKVDADVTFEPSYFALLLAEFESDVRLGMASGRRFEPTENGLREQRVTRNSVHAQCRAYRWECLQSVIPFDRAKGWDGIDEVKAQLGGWRVAVFEHLGFVHHRPIGSRERSRFSAWWQVKSQDVV